MTNPAGAGPVSDPSALNTRQRRFVLGLVAGKSQAQAYRDAGYASTTPDVNASRLLRNAKVRAAFREAAVIVESGSIADAAERQSFWTRVMRDTSADMRDRLKASELLARASGDFVERIQSESNIRVEFTIDPNLYPVDGFSPPDPHFGVIGGLPAPQRR